MKKLLFILAIATTFASAYAVGPKTYSKVVHSKHAVVVKFWASWCMPCSVMKPEFEAAKKSLGKRVLFAEYNVDLGGAPKYGVRSIPTMILYIDGKAVSQKVGGQSRDEIIAWIKSYI